MKNSVKSIYCSIIISGLTACNGGTSVGGASLNQDSEKKHTEAAAAISKAGNQCLVASELNLSSSSSVWYMSGSFKITNSCSIAQNVSGTNVNITTNNVNDKWTPSNFTVNSFSPWLGDSPNVSTSSNKNSLDLVISNSYSLASRANIIVNFGYNRNNTVLTMPLAVSIGGVNPIPSPTPSAAPSPTPSVVPSPTPSVVPSASPSPVPTPTYPVSSECLNGSNVTIDQKSIWWMSGSFTISNTCNIAKNINSASFIMKSSNSNDSLIGSGFQINSTTPYITGFTVSPTTVGKTLQLAFNGASINPGQSLKVDFGYNPNGMTLTGPFNLANNSLPPVLNSTLNLTVNSTNLAAVCTTPKPCNIKVMVANSEGSYNQQVAAITNTTAISNYSLTKLVSGSYTVTLQNLASNIAVTYTPSATAILGDNATQNISISFNVIPVPPAGQQRIVGYFETWAASYTSNASDYSLSKMPNYVNTINLAFAKPDAVYTPGSLTLSGTGIEVSISGQTLRDSIALAHAKQQIVLLSVGGATYGNFSNINIPALIAIVKDFDLDGIDLDYEVNSAGCTNINTNSISCTSDAALIDIINKLRNGLDNYKSGLKLTAAVWSIGAYGTPLFPTTSNGPVGSMSGIWINPLKQVGNKFNELYLMSYDAGNTTTTGYNPIAALKAYKSLTSVPVYLGIEVPPEAWGGNVTTPDVAVNLASQTRDLGGAGIMIWALHLKGTVGGVTYTANSYLQPICNLYGLGNNVCSQVVPAR